MDFKDMVGDVLHSTQFNHSTSDGFMLLGRGELPLPGTCIICEGSNCEEGYVTLNRFMDYYGNLAICVPDLIKIAEVVGCLAPQVRVMLMQNIQSVMDENKDLREKAIKDDERIAALHVLLGNASNDSSAHDLFVIDSNEKSGRSKPQVLDLTGGVVIDAGGRESESAEPVKSSKRPGVKKPSNADEKPAEGKKPLIEL